MNCPKCLSSFEQVAFEEITVDRCTNCRGIWFDLLEDQRLREMEHSEVLDSGSPEVGRRYNEFRDFDCPRCQTPLVKVVDPDQPHLKLESCKVCHGVFYDAGEFKDFKDETLRDVVRYYLRRTGR